MVPVPVLELNEGRQREDGEIGMAEVLLGSLAESVSATISWHARSASCPPGATIATGGLGIMNRTLTASS